MITTTAPAPTRRALAAWESSLLAGRAAALGAARQQVRVSASVRRSGGYGRRAVGAARLVEAANIRRAIVAGHLGAALLAAPARPADPYQLGGARWAWRSITRAARGDCPGARARSLRVDMALRIAHGLRVTVHDSKVCQARRADTRERGAQIRAYLAAYASLLYPTATPADPLVLAYGAQVYRDVMPVDREALNYAER